MRSKKELSEEWLKIRGTEEELAFPDVTIAGIKLTDELSYPINTKKKFAIWFSNNPDIPIPDTQASRLSDRAESNSGGETKLIYASKPLKKNARSILKEYAEGNEIQLIDINEVDPSKLSPTSKKLLDLAKQELEHVEKRTGGNPAGASDLIRWIPEITGDGIYADIDLPVTDQTQYDQIQYAGLPVLLHMGSIIGQPNPQRSKQEAGVINTDIIGFSPHEDAAIFISYVADYFFEAYKNPFSILEATNVKICKTAAYEQIKNNKGDLFALRQAVSNCKKNWGEFIEFLGETFIKEECERHWRLPTTKKEQHEYMDHMQKILYKPLVEEISGPGAVFRAIGGTNTLNDQRYRATLNMPTKPLRALELFGCINNMTPFLSDNIIGWQTSEENYDPSTLNTSGLSWMPDAQDEILQPIEKLNIHDNRYGLFYPHEDDANEEKINPGPEF